MNVAGNKPGSRATQRTSLARSVTLSLLGNGHVWERTLATSKRLKEMGMHGETAQVSKEETPVNASPFLLLLLPSPGGAQSLDFGHPGGSQSDRLRCSDVGKRADCTELNIKNEIK